MDIKQEINGLSSSEAEKLIKQYGYNEIKEKKNIQFKFFF